MKHATRAQIILIRRHLIEGAEPGFDPYVF
jgi:hypothetical protein